ncbi:TrkA family potassium uptake protein [Weissella diestrammenae]|uniref:TrkA family potassium uptake protein n=1 Tax=Weissella diestrammenae TaxID=1162633 RepID=A0A7G9T780_9LACO|nr:TrkA family potassium uptake protein [Weissella diestrammenae]MCM0582442.1 TrkA family potassium uptake protein [Weissella diestrammenae]QNN75955.1 TrkA family potassium uptake protein [Weissella diestrammenae]
MAQTFAVIGLGRFGSSLLESLINDGQEVLAIDNNQETIQEYMDIATHAVIADAQDEDSLKELDLPSLEHVIVAIGHNQQASILATILLKDLGCKHVIAKAENNLHARVLSKIGADEVVRPEHEMAQQVANRLVSPNLLNYITLSDEYSIGEIKISNFEFVNKTIADLDIRSEYGLNVIAIKAHESFIVAPEASYEIHIGDVLTVIGTCDNVQKFDRLVTGN